MTPPAIVLPFHDPQGIMAPYLWRLEAWLKQRFTRAFIGLTHPTCEMQPEAVKRLQSDPFYCLTYNPPGSLPGEHYRAVYHSAAERSPADQRLHLCDLDRPAFALLTGHRQAYLADFDWVNAQRQPALFQRSPAAWATYPQHYRQIEDMLGQVSELLYGQPYNFAWSYLVLQASDLAWLLPQLTCRDFGVLVEILILLRPRLLTRAVDWLAWEDPFILGRAAGELRSERDASRDETLKRLRGMLPLFNAILEKEPALQVELVWEKAAPNPAGE